MNLEEKILKYLGNCKELPYDTEIEQLAHALAEIAEEDHEVIVEGIVNIEQGYTMDFVKIDKKYIGEFTKDLYKYEDRKVKLILGVQE